MLNRPDWEVQCEGLLQALPPEMEPICDSRGEVKDKIFVCIKGGCHDGHTDAAGVLRRGAAAIVTQKKLGLPREYTVPDTRAALAVCVPATGASRPGSCDSSALPAPTARPLPPTCCATCCKAPGSRPGALGRTA